MQLQLKAEACAEEFLHNHGSLTSNPEISLPMETDGPTHAEAKVGWDEAAFDVDDDAPDALDAPSNVGEV
jgi:hypothetical protein